MVALSPVPNVLRISLQWELGLDLNANNHLYWLWSGNAPSNSDCANLAGAIAASVGTHFGSLYDADTTLFTTRVTDLTSPSSGDGTSTTQHVGTRPGPFLPASACIMVNYKIGRRYRGGKPRTYFPFGCQGDLLNAQNWNAAFVSSMTSAFTAFTGDMNAFVVGTTTMVGQVNVPFYHGVEQPVTLPSGRVKQSSKPRDPGTVVPDRITGFTVNPKMASQRRRNLMKA